MADRTGEPGERPNIIVIYADDMGWADIGSQGAKGFATPHIDRMAAEGTRYSAAYVPIPVCTPSRAALLTGCHPMRLGFGVRVLFPFSKEGLHLEEETIAESLREVGYATACFGKWHLGHHRKFLPTRQGFDHFFGIPYSNDMDGHFYKSRNFRSPPLPLFLGEKIIESAPDQAWFTKRFTDAAIEWIGENAERPFFLYLAHPMPHQPIHASKGFRGKSELGLYGDVIQELDDSVGRILAAVATHGLDKKTMVVFSSDNGPWRRASAGILRGKKGTTWEGGVRVPFVVRWPGRVPARRVVDDPISVLDLKPTLDALVGTQPSRRKIDGRSIVASLFGDSAPAGEPRCLAFYRNDRLQAVRQGPWKLHVYVPEGPARQRAEPRLFDLVGDPGEKQDVADAHPDVVHRLQGRAEEFRRELGDTVNKVKGRGVRPVGLIE